MFERNKQKISLLSGNQITVKSLSKRRCFWTWPFGHIWGPDEDNNDGYTRRCMICKKVSLKGSYDGNWMYDIVELNLPRTEGSEYHIRYAKSKCSIHKIIRRYVVVLFTIILMMICIGTCHKYYQFIPDTGLVARTNV